MPPTPANDNDHDHDHDHEHEHDLLASPARQAALDALASGPLTAAEVAARLGRHVTTVRFHLDRLIETGLVTSTVERGPTPGRPRLTYAVAPRPPRTAAPDEAHEALLAVLADALDVAGGRAQLSPEEAAARWAREHARGPAGEGLPSAPAQTPGELISKVGAVVDVLGAWGFETVVATADRGRSVTVSLTGCPFLALARAHPDVVCRVHVGLVRGALESVGEDATETRLEQFVAGGRCRADVTARLEVGAAVPALGDRTGEQETG